jgi:LPS sulfotransferase NodH
LEKFLVLAGRRSGVTFLVDSLDSHPEIECSKDVFSIRRRWKYFQVDVAIGKFYKFRSASRGRQLAYVLRRKWLINAFMTEIFGREGTAKARGIRLSYEQSRKYPRALEWSLENGIRVLHLTRENILKAILSNLIAKKRGVTHATSPLPRVTVRVPPGELKKLLIDREKLVERYRKRLQGGHHLEISYESFLARRESETRRILDFLGIDHFVPLTSQYVKQNPDSVAEILENYAEVARAFAGTPFARYLEPAEG